MCITYVHCTLYNPTLNIANGETNWLVGQAFRAQTSINGNAEDSASPILRVCMASTGRFLAHFHFVVHTRDTKMRRLGRFVVVPAAA